MRSIVLLGRTLEMLFIEQIRYPVEYFVGLVNSTMFVTMILVGMRAGGAQHMEKTGIALVMNFVLIQAINACVRFLDTRGADAEEAYFYPIRLEMQLAASSLAEMINQYVVYSFTYLILAKLMGLPLMGVWLIARYCLILFAASLGVGYLLAAAHLLFKRVYPLAGLVTLFVLGTSFFGEEFVDWLATWLPFAMGVKAAAGKPVDQITLAVSSALFLLIGLAVFRLARNLTTRYGLTGVR